MNNRKFIVTEEQFKYLLEATSADARFGAPSQNVIQAPTLNLKPVNTTASRSYGGNRNFQPMNSKLNFDTSLPRGYRNNNPLNIRISNNNAWQGKIGNNTDGAFEQFVSPQYGYRAASRLITNYIKSGRNTVSSIISKWAPSNENNTNGYINRVCTTSGFRPDTVIDPNNKEQMSKLLYAMAIVENGNVPGQPKMSEIQSGVNMA